MRASLCPCPSPLRGWSLRGQIVYPVLGEDSQVLAWVARDPQYEAKEQAFNALPPEQRAREKRPAKHKVPADFQRGLELFGQQAGGHTTHEQEPVDGALVAHEHAVARADRDRAVIVDAALAVLAQRVQQDEGFVSGSVPGNSSWHGGVRSPLTG